MIRAALLVALVACSSSPKPRPDPPNAPDPPLLALELVESTPIETTLDSDLPNADTVWLEMIGSAKTSLDFAEFYASNAPGSKLEPIIVAIEDAIRRGVKVRFLSDKSFVKTYPDTLDRLRKAGAAVRDIDLSPGVLHAKYFVVDGGHEAFLGSQNFDYRALEHNLELGVRIRDGAVAKDLAAIFALDWSRSGGEPAPATAAPTSRLVASPRDHLPAGVNWDLPALIAMIDNAHANVRLQALTYRAGDWMELEDALVRAAKRGVPVELMVSDWAKAPKTIGGLQQLARTPNIAIKLVTIPQAASGFIPYARVIHAKLLVTDGDFAWVGTGNFEKDYFYEGRNVGVRGVSVFATSVENFFERTWKSPYATPIDPDATYAAPKRN